MFKGWEKERGEIAILVLIIALGIFIHALPKNPVL